jgi:hypothetical protein
MGPSACTHSCFVHLVRTFRLGISDLLIAARAVLIGTADSRVLNTPGRLRSDAACPGLQVHGQ